jgi:hypothetical protein
MMRPMSGHDPSRRAALQGLAASLGAAVGASTARAETPHPMGAHVVQRSRATQPARTAPPVPRFFDAHQYATLTAIADVILPGSVASASPQYIDEVLAVEHPPAQQSVVGALGAIDARAGELHRRPFKDLARAEQVALLEEAAARESVEAPGPVGILKPWIAGAHFSSEAGMKELGWTGGVFFASFNACPHPDGHD